MKRNPPKFHRDIFLKAVAVVEQCDYPSLSRAITQPRCDGGLSDIPSPHFKGAGVWEKRA